jgi:hypothetical protein
MINPDDAKFAAFLFLAVVLVGCAALAVEAWRRNHRGR